MKKTKNKSLKLNMVMNAILTMSSFIFPLITFPYVSRILLPEGTGKVSFAISVVTYFSMFAQLGIPTYGIKACAGVRDDKDKLSRTVQELMIINLIMCIIAYAGFIIALNYIPRLQQEKTLFIIVSFTIIFNAIGVEWLYKAVEEYTYITVRSIIFKFIALIAMFVLIHEKSDYVIYGGISIFAACASNVLNFINLRKIVNMRPVGHYNFSRHIKMIFVFFAMSVATVIYTHLDTVMLGFMKTDIDVGYYNAAIKIKTILVSIVTSVSAVLLPRSSYYVKKGLMNEFYEITQKALNFVLLISIPMAVYFILFARYGVLFLSGSAYEGAIVPMQVIMPTLVFIGMTNVIGIQMMIPLGKEKQVLYSEIVGAVIDTVINIVLIPKYGAAGAATGTLVAEIFVFLWQYAVMRNILKDTFRKKRYSLMILSLGCSILTSIWILKLNMSNFITLAISAILFFAVYFAVLLVAKEDMVLELKNQAMNKIKEKSERNSI